VFIIDKHPREVQSNNMKLPLLGIMLVVLVQLGFTAYNAVDRPLESLVAVSAVMRGTNPLASTVDEDYTVYDADRGSYRTPSRTAAFQNKRREIPEEAVFVPAKGRRSFVNSRLVAMERPFENVTITYYRAPTPGGEPDNHPANYHRSVVPAPEPRSFASSAAAVVKKPYDWVKTLASKLK